MTEPPAGTSDAHGSQHAGEAREGHRPGHVIPAWRRATDGEARWPVSVVVVIAIALQIRLPARLTVHPRWLLPALEAILLIVLVASNRGRIKDTPSWLRTVSIGLIAVASAGNAWSALHLVNELISGRAGDAARPLLTTGGAIWLTNVIIFALWYWELDRGGPAARANATMVYPDFMFPQMTDPTLAPHDWEPGFADYFYTSFTNATAFSPTDVMPLTRWAKFMMLAQSAVSLITVALVIARAVNVLK